MSTLIVDFPRERNRKVKLSVMSALWVVECYKENDKSKIWYSEHEYNRMRFEFRQSMQKKIDTNRRSPAGQEVDTMGNTPNAGTDTRQEDDTDLLGSNNAVSWVKAHKENHMRAVLEEQARQDQSGEWNPYKIASVSQRYSHVSSTRARRHRRSFL